MGQRSRDRRRSLAGLALLILALVVMSPDKGNALANDAEADRFAEVQGVNPGPDLCQGRLRVGGLDRDGLVTSRSIAGCRPILMTRTSPHDRLPPNRQR